MKSTLAFSFFLFFAFLSNAQDRCDKFQKESIMYVRPYAFFRGGESHPAGLFYGKLKKELEVSPMAIAEFKKYRTNRNIAYLMSGASLGALIGAGYMDDRRWQGAFLIGSLGLSIGSIRFSLDATDNLHRSVWLHNEDLLIQR